VRCRAAGIKESCKILDYIGCIRAKHDMKYSKKESQYRIKNGLLLQFLTRIGKADPEKINIKDFENFFKR